MSEPMRTPSEAPEPPVSPPAPAVTSAADRLEPPRGLVLAAAVFAGARVIGSRVRGVAVSAVIIAVGWNYVSWDGTHLQRQVAGLMEHEEARGRPLVGGAAPDPMESVAELARPLLAQSRESGSSERAEALKAELVRMRESLEQARADAQRLRQDVAREHDRRKAIVMDIKQASAAKAQLQAELAKTQMAGVAAPSQPALTETNDSRQLASVAPVPTPEAATPPPVATAPTLPAEAPAPREEPGTPPDVTVAHVETVAQDAQTLEEPALQLPVSITRRRPEDAGEEQAGVPSSVKRHLSVFRPAQL